MKWLWIILAAIYLLSPYDILPGLSAIGWLDDIFVLILLYRYLSGLSRRGRSDQGPYAGQASTRQEDERPQGDPPPPSRSPHDILEVAPDATADEIKAAYRRLVNQYHPDKVSHLGDEFQMLAEKRFKEIQEAYQKLVR